MFMSGAVYVYMSVCEVERKRQFVSWGGRAVSANRYSNKTARLAQTHMHTHTLADTLFTFGRI